MDQPSPLGGTTASVGVATVCRQYRLVTTMHIFSNQQTERNKKYTIIRIH